MGELQAVDSVSPIVAILWVFYPMAALVLVEVLLRIFRNDDDDDDGGKGVRVWQPATVPTGA
tara:strand:+ start:1086 stop:1271 length:186 start_codon:yes stop_codon:yes gene_type:complete